MIPAFTDTLCRAIPMILIGGEISRRRKNYSLVKVLMGTGISFLMNIVEIKILSIMAPEQYDFPYRMATPFCIFYGFMLLLKVGSSIEFPYQTKVIRQMSGYLYYIHPMFIGGAALLSISRGVELFWIVLGASVLFGFVAIMLKYYRSKKEI